jgi:hypothetical protein
MERIRKRHAPEAVVEFEDFASLIQETAGQIESGHFLPYSGIRFPQNPCVACSYLGLCLDKQDLVGLRLVRRSGGSVCVFDDLTY